MLKKAIIVHSLLYSFCIFSSVPNAPVNHEALRSQRIANSIVSRHMRDNADELVSLINESRELQNAFPGSKISKDYFESIIEMITSAPMQINNQPTPTTIPHIVQIILSKFVRNNTQIIKSLFDSYPETRHMLHDTKIIVFGIPFHKKKDTK